MSLTKKILILVIALVSLITIINGVELFVTASENQPDGFLASDFILAFSLLATFLIIMIFIMNTLKKLDSELESHIKVALCLVLATTFLIMLSAILKIAIKNSSNHGSMIDLLKGSLITQGMGEITLLPSIGYLGFAIGSSI